MFAIVERERRAIKSRVGYIVMPHLKEVLAQVLNFCGKLLLTLLCRGGS